MRQTFPTIKQVANNIHLKSHNTVIMFQAKNHYILNLASIVTSAKPHIKSIDHHSDRDLRSITN